MSFPLRYITSALSSFALLWIWFLWHLLDWVYWEETAYIFMCCLFRITYSTALHLLSLTWFETYFTFISCIIPLSYVASHYIILQRAAFFSALRIIYLALHSNFGLHYIWHLLFTLPSVALQCHALHCFASKCNACLQYLSLTYTTCHCSVGNQLE